FVHSKNTLYQEYQNLTFICIFFIIEGSTSCLHKHFGIKDLGVMKFFLRVEATHSATSISFCQRQYCSDLLHDTGTIGYEYSILKSMELVFYDEDIFLEGGNI
ncbi:hypothetical protein CR513_01674, partial [Mucuna pruriens]